MALYAITGLQSMASLSYLVFASLYLAPVEQDLLLFHSWRPNHHVFQKPSEVPPLHPSPISSMHYAPFT